MKNLALLLLTVAAWAAADSTAQAQFGGIGGNIGIGLGGGGGGMRQPGRKLGAPTLQRNQSPVLSPALNMLPGVSQSFEGQFLMRTVPQEQFYNTTRQANRAFQNVQGEIATNRNMIQNAELQTGLTQTGKRVRFMDISTFYPAAGANR